MVEEQEVGVQKFLGRLEMDWHSCDLNLLYPWHTFVMLIAFGDSRAGMTEASRVANVPLGV